VVLLVHLPAERAADEEEMVIAVTHGVIFEHEL
jgi:hypothetical protein